MDFLVLGVPFVWLLRPGTYSIKAVVTTLIGASVGAVGVQTACELIMSRAVSHTCSPASYYKHFDAGYANTFMCGT